MKTLRECLAVPSYLKALDEYVEMALVFGSERTNPIVIYNNAESPTPQLAFFISLESCYGDIFYPKLELVPAEKQTLQDVVDLIKEFKCLADSLL